MKAILTATALAGALALTPLAALSQESPGQTEMPEIQATEAPDAREFRVIMSAEDLEGRDFTEVRVESVEEVPRDHVQAINNALDPANPDAQALRERLSALEGFEQALSEENVEEERVVGAAIKEGDLVVYVLPAGETRETWGARMPDPTTEAEPGTAPAERPGTMDTPAADQQPGTGGTNY